MRIAFCLWVGPWPWVVIGSATAAEPILTSTTLLNKSDEYEALVPWIGTGLLTAKKEKWSVRRKMLTPTFHFNILNTFMPIFNKQSKILQECLAKNADTNHTFDMYLPIKRCALDVICETAMGTSVDAQIKTDNAYLVAVLAMNELTFKYMRQPWLWFPPIWYALGYGARYNFNLKLLQDFTRNVITSREKALIEEANELRCKLSEIPVKRSEFDETVSGKKRLAFLDLLLCMKEDYNLSMEDIREETDTFMFEGHDTTGSSMGFTTYAIGLYPDVQAKVQEELDRVLGPPPLNRDITSQDLNELKYLERCIKEGLRMVPPVPMFGRTVTEDFKTGKYTIPSGSTAIVVPQVIHHDKKEWGENVDEFDPDRFLPDRSVGRSPFAFIPFSAGGRNCIGQKFALMEEKVVMAHLLHSYRVEGTVPLNDRSMRWLPEIVTRPPNGFPMKLYKRY